MLLIVDDFIPEGRKNRPGNKLVPQYITVHNTSNYSPGADAAMHGKYLKGDEAAGKPVSWHYTVDDKQAVKHLPLSETGWHSGDGKGPGNITSIGIEICTNAGGNIGVAEDNAAELIAQLLKSYGLPIGRVVQHNHWTGKDCPHEIRSRPGGWEKFLNLIAKKLHGEPEAEAELKALRLKVGELTAENMALREKLKGIAELIKVYA